MVQSRSTTAVNTGPAPHLRYVIVLLATLVPLTLWLPRQYGLA